MLLLYTVERSKIPNDRAVIHYPTRPPKPKNKKDFAPILVGMMSDLLLIHPLPLVCVMCEGKKIEATAGIIPFRNKV
jgi:hypothetical protein